MKNQTVCRKTDMEKDRDSLFYYIFHDLPIGVVIIHPDGTLLCKNNWVRTYLNTKKYTSARIGSDIHCFRLKKAGMVCGGMKSCEQCALKKGTNRILAEGRPMGGITIRITDKGKENTWLKIYGSPMLYNGETYAVLYLEDITAFKRKERHLTKRLKLDPAMY